jgi:hypothetical protein
MPHRFTFGNGGCKKRRQPCLKLDGATPVGTVDPAELYKEIGRGQMALDWLKERAVEFDV